MAERDLLNQNGQPLQDEEDDHSNLQRSTGGRSKSSLTISESRNGLRVNFMLQKNILNNLLNWIYCKINRWLVYRLNIFSLCLKSHRLGFIYFRHFGTFLIRPVSMIPWLLNLMIFWIESPEFVLNRIKGWFKFWVSKIELNIELNQIGYLAGLFHAAESKQSSLSISFNLHHGNLSICHFTCDQKQLHQGQTSAS